MPSPRLKLTPPTTSRLSDHLLLGRTASDLSDAELLAVLLGQGEPTALDLAGRLLAGKSLRRLCPSRAIDLQHHGASLRGAATVVAAYDLARRLTADEFQALSSPLHQPELVARYLTLHHANPDQEILGALYLDARYRPITSNEIYRGTLSRASVEPRGVLKEAILLGAAALVLFHTHPSGDTTPSAEDKRMTERMRNACLLMGVEFLDHLVITCEGRWTRL